MRYFVLAADYHDDFCLRDEFTSESAMNNEAIDIEMRDRINQWNQRYMPFIVGTASKVDSIDEIVRLDRDGYDIAQAVQGAIGVGAKVKYYSEGQGTYLFHRKR
jgi:hypothetical protein